MKRIIIWTTICIAVLSVGCGANAGVYSDDLGKCLVSTSNADDKIILMQWMFAAASQNPAIKPMSNINAAQKTDYDKKMAALTERLLTIDCRAQAVAALKYEGDSGLQSSFELFGKVAATGLFNDPSANAAMSGFAAYLDQNKFVELRRDAGLGDGSDKSSK